MDANSKIKSVLEKLLDEHLLGADKSDFIEFKTESLLSETVDARALSRVIDHLKDKGLIKESIFWRGEDAEYEEEPDYDFYKISFPKDFRVRAAEYIVELDSSDRTTASTLVLYLDGNGNFWHGDKSKLCYVMDATSQRLKILSYLVDNADFQSIDTIAEYLGVENKQNIRSEIGKIRKNITHNLKIDGDELIESKPSSGYRINPKYKVARTS